MYKKLSEYFNDIKDKKIAIVGYGISNSALLEFLSTSEAKISLFDASSNIKTDEIQSKYQNKNIDFYFGTNYLSYLNGFDIIFRTPVMRPDIPEFIQEKIAGAIITSEIELFFELCPCEIIAVTGSDGKTTTTTLIHHLLSNNGYTCWLGGNIGTPLINKLNTISVNDKVVLELSSFQLMTMNVSPNIAVVLNITPNHLDIHTSMDEYIQAKKNIFKYQSHTNRVIFNLDCELCASFIPECHSNVLVYSLHPIKENGFFVENNEIFYLNDNQKQGIMSTKEIRLLGLHNLQNFMAAIAATIDYVNIDTIKHVANTFNGVEHRMEYVTTKNEISFYNDSIGSSPNRTMAGLQLFDKKVILIAGGYDKNLSYTELGKTILEKVKRLILIGQTASKINEAVQKSCNNPQIPIDIVFCNTLEDAVYEAYNAALEGDKIVLSPASASFDMFKNFEERGNAYKSIIANL